MNSTKILVVEVVLIFIVGITAGYIGSYIENTRFSKSLKLSQLVAPASPVIEQKKVIIEENQALNQAIQEVQLDVVPIFRMENHNPTVIANGFSLTRDGLIVALSASLPRKNLSNVFIGKKTVSFQVLKRDPLYNLALVKMKGDGFRTSGFINKEDVKLGGEIFTLSSTFLSVTSSSSSLNFIVNKGLISQIKQNYYLTDIPAGENFDGSPCFNNKGEFVGLGENSKNGHLIIIPASVIREFAGL